MHRGPHLKQIENQFNKGALWNRRETSRRNRPVSNRHEGRNRKIHHLKASREDSYQTGNSTRVPPRRSGFFKETYLLSLFTYGLLIHEFYLPWNVRARIECYRLVYVPKWIVTSIDFYLRIFSWLEIMCPLSSQCTFFYFLGTDMKFLIFVLLFVQKWCQ